MSESPLLTRARITITNTQTTAHLNPSIKFPTMWYVRPAKSQISMRVRTV